MNTRPLIRSLLCLLLASSRNEIDIIFKSTSLDNSFYFLSRIKLTNIECTGDAFPGAASSSFPLYKQAQAFSQNKVAVLTYKPNGEVTHCLRGPARQWRGPARLEQSPRGACVVRAFPWPSTQATPLLVSP